MTNKQTKKAKRPLQTTLGKAPSQNEKEVDLSHVKRPIETSIYGLHQVMNLLKTATDEVKDYIIFECDVMFECRVCRSIFRSLANFILHKRNYCSIKYKSFSSNCQEDSSLEKVPPPEPPEGKRVDKDVKGLVHVVDKLKEKQEIKQLTQELLNADLSIEKKDEGSTTAVIPENDIFLEEIASNYAAVFQTVLQSMPQQSALQPEYMKKEVMELHGIMESDKVVLGAEGKICNFQTSKINANSTLPKKELSCSDCNIKFSTRKTLSFHLKNKHNNSRLVYVCPECKETYSNAWSVYRHLYKVHRKTAAQVKRLREQVHNSVMRKDQETHKKIEKKDSSNLDKDKTDEENQWLNNIEGDNDFQMCGGCGKRFERKAALQSHAAMCIKRIAVCNSIKENNAKKKEEESKDTKAKTNKLDKSPSTDIPHLKGASKRKPYLLRTYKKICASGDQTKSDCGNTTVETTCDKVVSAKREEVSDNNKSEHNYCDNQANEICDVNDINRVEEDCDSAKQKISSDTATVLNEEMEKCAKDEKCVCSLTCKTDVENVAGMTLIGSIDPDDRIEVIKEEIISPPRQSDHFDIKCNEQFSEFDGFCEEVTGHLRNIGNVSIDKSEKAATPPIDTAKILESDLQETPKRSVDFYSPGKISIKSLEELRGFPRQPEPINIKMLPTPSMSPKTPKRSPKRIVKRKSSSLFDSDRTHKTFRQSNFDILLDKQDIDFMAKASPHIDRNTMTCKACQIKYSSFSKLLWHMSSHFSWFRFQCSRCSFVSFGKSECAAHAKSAHSIRTGEISSVVLPIPNWKTHLMSNEFKELKSEGELGGKHTDEINRCCQDETTVRDNDDNDTTINVINTLFVDSESELADLNELSDLKSFPIPVPDETSVENQCIDITDDDQESFQLEIPQEMYTLDVFEVINEDDVDERRPQIKEETDPIAAPFLSDNTWEVPKVREVWEISYDKISETPGDAIAENSTEEICQQDVNEVPNGESTEREELNKSPSNNLANIRPTRNRMRSIKTLQNDFFYDLGKANKPTDAVAKTNVPPKQKKNNGSSNVKKEK